MQNGSVCRLCSQARSGTSAPLGILKARDTGSEKRFGLFAPCGLIAGFGDERELVGSLSLARMKRRTDLGSCRHGDCVIAVPLGFAGLASSSGSEYVVSTEMLPCFRVLGYNRMLRAFARCLSISSGPREFASLDVARTRKIRRRIAHRPTRHPSHRRRSHRFENGPERSLTGGRSASRGLVGSSEGTGNATHVIGSDR